MQLGTTSERFGWEIKYMQNCELQAIFAAYDWTQPRKLNW